MTIHLGNTGQDHHVRIAAATFEALVQNYEGQIFTLTNLDLFFIVRNAAIEDIDAAIMKVRHLFSGDPLTQGDDEDDMARFCTWFNVDAQHDDLLDMIKQLHRERERKSRMAATSGRPDNRKRASKKPLDPEQLGKLEIFLARADLSNLMRR